MKTHYCGDVKMRQKREKILFFVRSSGLRLKEVARDWIVMPVVAVERVTQGNESVASLSRDRRSITDFLFFLSQKALQPFFL